VADSVKRKKRLSFTVSSLMTVGGLIALICGGRMTVIAAVNIARAVGISEAVIGLTIISFGTTLPELVTGIVAARRGEGDIAIGNVVGSNIFNLLFIGGVVSVINPILVPLGGMADLLALLGLSILLWPIAIRGNRTVTRAEGAFLLILYICYLAYRI